MNREKLGMIFMVTFMVGFGGAAGFLAPVPSFSSEEADKSAESVEEVVAEEPEMVVEEISYEIVHDQPEALDEEELRAQILSSDITGDYPLYEEGIVSGAELLMLAKEDEQLLEALISLGRVEDFAHLERLVEEGLIIILIPEGTELTNTFRRDYDSGVEPYVTTLESDRHALATNEGEPLLLSSCGNPVDPPDLPDPDPEDPDPPIPPLPPPPPPDDECPDEDPGPDPPLPPPDDECPDEDPGPDPPLPPPDDECPDDGGPGPDPDLPDPDPDPQPCPDDGGPGPDPDLPSNPGGSGDSGDSGGDSEPDSGNGGNDSDGPGDDPPLP